LWHSSYTPMEGMKELARQLREKYKVIVFSGNVKERVKFLDKKYGLMSDFDDYIFSFKTGYNKREREFYNILLNKIHCQPEECVFIDNDQHSLDFAGRHGFKTILFQDARQLKRELSKLGVKM
ncbi:MAG: HAD-IA family hydrolase, partial [Patescibacteria group bacterium]|nr:HAD-IA family hydrolase [Patescibacteria group bacterium]